MRKRSLLIGALSMCLIPGADDAQAQSSNTPDAAETLPAIEVAPPATAARPGRNRGAARTTQNVRRVYVYPTSPTPTAGSGIDVDKVPAGINAVGAGQIQRTGSLNVADALQQQMPGVVGETENLRHLWSLQRTGALDRKPGQGAQHCQIRSTSR